MGATKLIRDFLEPIVTGPETGNLGQVLGELSQGRPVALPWNGRWYLLLPARVAGYPSSRRLIDLPLAEVPAVPPGLTVAEALACMPGQEYSHALVIDKGQLLGVVGKERLREHLGASDHSRTATALQVSEELNRRILEAVPGGIVAVAADGSILQANVEAQRILGLSWDELSRRFVHDFAVQTVWEDGSPCPVEDYPVSRCLRTGQAQAAATIGVRRPDGYTSWAIYTAVPVLDPKSALPAGAVVTFVDITQRKQAEEALRANETRLRLLVWQIPAILWTTDVDLRITSSTGAALSNLNLRPNELVGVSLFDYFGTKDADFLPIAAAHRAVAGESVTFEVTWQGRTFHAHVEPFLDNTGRRLGSIGVALDITERKRAEAILQRQAQIIDQIHDAVISTDLEGFITGWNQGAERLYGYQAAEIIGQHIGVLHPEEDLPQIPQRLLAALKNKGKHEVELRVCNKAGTPFYVQLSLSLQRAADGSPSGLIGYSIDITARKRAEEKLQQYARDLHALSRRLLDVQEQERRHLARELHDEIGQLLTGLKFTLEMGNRLQGDEVRAALGAARAVVADLTTRVRELSLRLRPTMLDDLGLLPALLWHFERYTAQTHIQVVFEHRGLEPRLPPEVETAAYRIVQEALTNVARYAGVAEVVVRVWLTGGSLGVQVEDRGAGFDPAAVLADGVSSGLSGIRERAALLGGRLTVESLPGSGTRLTAEVPAILAKETSRHDVDAHAGG